MKKHLKRNAKRGPTPTFRNQAAITLMRGISFNTGVIYAYRSQSVSGRTQIPDAIHINQAIVEASVPCLKGQY